MSIKFDINHKIIWYIDKIHSNKLVFVTKKILTGFLKVVDFDVFVDKSNG